VEYIIPNSKFLDNSVTNWTLSNTEVRVCVQVGVAYGSPTDRVSKLLRQAVNELPQALAHREPIILFTDFGDNALHFAAHFWIHLRTEMDGYRAESDLRQRIDALFREAGISIAFPQRDVHLDLSQPIELKLPSPRESFAEHLPQRRAG
jgi:small-conductance mechanosensitive channel